MVARVARALVAAVLAIALILLGRMTPAVADAAADEVHYTFTGGTSVALDWRGTAQDVRYGLTTDYGQTATGTAPQWTPISSAGPFWQAQISGLTAATTYHYSIGGGPDYTFHTPPAAGQSFRFDAIGDIGDTTHFSHLADTFSAIAADQPSFVIMDGDLTYANAANATQTVVDQHFNDVMAWSTSAAYMPAWGNHEWESPAVDDLRNYKGRLLMPNAQASPGSPETSCCGDDWGWSTRVASGSSRIRSRTPRRPGATGRRRPAPSWPTRRTIPRSATSSRSATGPRTPPDITPETARSRAFSTGLARPTASTC